MTNNHAIYTKEKKKKKKKKKNYFVLHIRND